MEIQEHLLIEQLKAISGSPLSQIIMKGAHPATLSEFRRQAPLTRYEDYRPYIGKCQEEHLLPKPAGWARTSGKGGEPKWIPYTNESLDQVIAIAIASMILACASRKGDIRITNNARIMQNLPPPPYFSGIIGERMVKEGFLNMIPPLEKYKDQPFEKRMRDGYKMALRSPIDVLGSLTAVLIKMGESFTEDHDRRIFSRDMLDPRILLRLTAAYLKSKKEHRSILPKDLWPLKGLIGYGMDTSVYRQQLKYYWGKEPLEIYSSTECGMLALQSWNKKALTFIPFSGFLEFIPEVEWIESRQNSNYQPRTILMDEVRVGNLYELVFTSFHGMPFLRYRMGDLIKVVGRKDMEAGIQLPQVIFQARGDDVLDINGFARLDEKTIWQALTDTGVKFAGWSARKEFRDNKPFVHIYIEPKNGTDITNLEQRIHENLIHINKDYKDLNEMLGVLPIKVTRLSPRSFQRYYESKTRIGADLAHLKPPQMNAPDREIEEFLVISNQEERVN